MKLVSVYDEPSSMKVLYDLLATRNSGQNISHRRMPTWEDHIAFVESTPYYGWFLIDDDGYVGSIYLSRQNEVGVFLFPEFQAKGYAPAAIRLLMERFSPRRYLANINPKNEASIRMFGRLGFKHIQNTYELNA